MLLLTKLPVPLPFQGDASLVERDANDRLLLSFHIVDESLVNNNFFEHSSHNSHQHTLELMFSLFYLEKLLFKEVELVGDTLIFRLLSICRATFHHIVPYFLFQLLYTSDSGNKT